jgi:hypothetical protein
MQCAVFETSHHKFYRDATLRNGKLVCQRSNHQTCRFERRRYFFAPTRLLLFQVIEHSDADGKPAVFLDNIRVKARETKTVLALEKIHWPAFAKPPRADASDGSAQDLLLSRLRWLLLQFDFLATAARTDA